MPGEVVRRFREWFWRPPRAHGDVLRDRSVSFLELLYDLVYVAVIAQAAQRLSTDISGVAIGQFAVVFTLIWIAWVNGTLYLELHGREDGRTRLSVFFQMGIVALLAVYAGIAADDLGGARFALVYVGFLLTLAWLWNSVRRQDRPEVARVTLQYELVLVVSAAVMLGSAILEPGTRLLVWAAFGGLWIATMLGLGFRTRSFSIGVTPTHSMVERFGLFILIVLGEVVVGVVDGLSHAEQDAITVVTGSLAMIIGFGFWWIYFDLVGRREPRPEGRRIVTWVLSHLPITLAISAAGAGMVGLIEHAHDELAPPATAWLLSGSVATVLIAQVVHGWTLEAAREQAAVYRPLTVALVVAAAAALAVGWLRPAPWLLALALVGILTLLWFYAVVLFIRARAWPPP
ncbi:MAG TPA: low temperature requirement protein A [Candidatus Limnocylindrales bacterium]